MFEFAGLDRWIHHIRLRLMTDGEDFEYDDDDDD